MENERRRKQEMATVDILRLLEDRMQRGYVSRMFLSLKRKTELFSNRKCCIEISSHLATMSISSRLAKSIFRSRSLTVKYPKLPPSVIANNFPFADITLRNT